MRFRSTTALQPICGPKQRKSAERLVYVSVTSLEGEFSWGVVRDTYNIHRVLCHQTRGCGVKMEVNGVGDGEVEDGKASIKPFPVWPHL